jgi:hypothetical protein
MLSFTHFLKEAALRVDTTQNASITELFPALAFNNNYKPTDINKFADWLRALKLSSPKAKTAFVTTSNVEAGAKVNETTSSMQAKFFKDKMNNAIGITNWLYSINRTKKIKRVVWGYREKPTGIPKNHAGDIFIFFNDGSTIGVSLKAGTKKSKEPLLNTYVGTTFKKIKQEKKLTKLADAMWDTVYSKIPGVNSVATKRDYMERGIKNKVTEKYIEYFLENEEAANKLYTEMLYVNRVHMTDAINSLSLKEFKDWVISNFNLQLPTTDGDIPLILVKAVGKTAEEKSDDLAAMIGTLTSFKAVLNTSSVQEWFIEIADATGNKAKMKMAIRSDAGVRAGKAPGKQGRLGKYTQLKLQYSGLV